MLKLASITLLFAICIPVRAEFLSFEEKEPDVILDSTANALDSAPKSQAAWGKGLKKVGPRCVKGWDSFAPKYDPLEARFNQFAKGAASDVRQIQKDLQGLNYSGLDAPAATEVNAENACGAKAAGVAKRMEEAKLKVAKAMVKLDSLQDDLGKISEEGMDVFRKKAGDDYARGVFCLRKHYYTDVAEITFGKSPLEHNSGDDSGFAIAQWRLNRAAQRLEVEHSKIDLLQSKFKVMQGNCNKKPSDDGDASDGAAHTAK